MQFAVTRVAHPEGKQSKRKGTGAARALPVRWERPSSATVHVQREKHDEQTESSEPTVSPQPRAASPPVQRRGAAWGHSRSSRDLGWTPRPGLHQPPYTEDIGQQGTSIARHLMLRRDPAPKRATDTQAAKHPRGALVGSAIEARRHATASPCPAAAALSSKRCKLLPRPRQGDWVLLLLPPTPVGTSGGSSGTPASIPPAPAWLSTLTSRSQHHRSSGATAFSRASRRRGEDGSTAWEPFACPFGSDQMGHVILNPL